MNRNGFGDDLDDLGQRSAVDETLKHPTDQPGIGLILCRTKKQLVVENTLQGTKTPMGIAEFTHRAKLPNKFKGSPPTIEELEAELGTADWQAT